MILKTIIHVYSPGGYTQLQDLSDLQDDVPDVFRTTIIKIKGNEKLYYAVLVFLVLADLTISKRVVNLSSNG